MMVEMVESKRKNLVSVDVNNNKKTLDDEDDWIIVKKQRINILIPRLPSNDPSMEPHPEQDQLHTTSSFINDGSICSSPLLNIESNQNVLPPVDNGESILKPGKPDLGTLNVEDQVGALTAFPRKTKCPPELSTSSKNIRPSIHSGISGLCNVSTSTTKIRALKLESNISSAGGLSKWLSSLGLERFERLFVGKYCLVDLSMKKLKDMGVHAVGPRRKLMHAIESGIQP